MIRPYTVPVNSRSAFDNNLRFTWAWIVCMRIASICEMGTACLVSAAIRVWGNKKAPGNDQGLDDYGEPLRREARAVERGSKEMEKVAGPSR